MGSSKLTVGDKVVLVGVAIYVVWVVITIVSQNTMPLYIDPLNSTVTENIV